ncbi:hypothetical protein [Marinivivus vitaminiproducens]|uniref:hypothetical protein n=1 Tax=Marinivivus vitaminiproducens TaxID=3035935 RepID=UPI0027AB0EF6|nr:hypothetical protein P4R82_10320 [Geminicoccaceae bacterium SCSIO 64248]
MSGPVRQGFVPARSAKSSDSACEAVMARLRLAIVQVAHHPLAALPTYLKGLGHRRAGESREQRGEYGRVSAEARNQADR